MVSSKAVGQRQQLWFLGGILQKMAVFRSVLDLFADLDAARKHISLHFDCRLVLSNELAQAVEQQHANSSF